MLIEKPWMATQIPVTSLDPSVPATNSASWPVKT
jgi:hypothetical protein